MLATPSLGWSNHVIENPAPIARINSLGKGDLAEHISERLHKVIENREQVILQKDLHCVRAITTQQEEFSGKKRHCVNNVLLS